MGAAGNGVPVLRDGHVRGAATWRACRAGVLRGGADRRRGSADRVRERAARAGCAGHGHAARGAGLAGEAMLAALAAEDVLAADETR